VDGSPWVADNSAIKSACQSFKLFLVAATLLDPVPAVLLLGLPRSGNLGLLFIYFYTFSRKKTVDW